MPPVVGMTTDRENISSRVLVEVAVAGDDELAHLCVVDGLVGVAEPGAGVFSVVGI